MAAPDDDFADAMTAAAPGTAAPPTGDDDFADAMANAHAPVDGPAPPPPNAPPPTPRMARRRGVAAPDTAEAATPAPDATNDSLETMLSTAAGNFIPSFAGQVKGIVAPLLPQNWAGDVTTATQLGKGALSKAGLIDQNDPAAKTKDEALVNALGHYYAQKYTTEGGFKSAFEQDPASFLTDAASVATIPAGGEGLAAKIPGVFGDAALATAKAAGVVERATNPLSLTARAVGALLPGASATARTAGSLAERALPGLDAADVASDPATVASIQGVVGQKGPTLPAAREGVMRRFDNPNSPTPVPTSLVTGQAPPPAAMNAVADASSQWRQNFGNWATTLTGAPEASPTDLGSAIEQAQIARHNQYVANYDTVAQHQGSFDPSFAPALRPAIDQSLADSNLPSAANLPKYPQYATTVDAANWLTGHVDDLAANGNLTPQALMEARKGLSYYWSQARGPDEKGIGALTDALDTHIQNSATSGGFSGDPAVASDMANAVASFRGYKQDFANNSNPAHGAVASAMKNLIPDQVRDPVTGMITAPAPEGGAMAAQGSLTGKLVNPRTLASPAGAARLYGKLTDVLGGPTSEGAQALNDYVRQTVTATNHDGSLIAKPDQIHGFLDGPLSNVFAPSEQSQLRQLAEAQRLVTTRPTMAASAASNIGAMAGRLGRGLAFGAAGHIIGGPLGHVVGGGLAEFAGEHGGILGGMAEQALEPMLSRGAAAKALRGAPASRNLLTLPKRVAKSVAERRGTSLAGAFYGAGPAPMAIASKEQNTGDSADAAALIEKAEGRGKNPRSSAQGSFQMINSTWGSEFRKMYPDQAKGMSDTQIAKAYRNTPQGQAATESLGRNHVAGELGFLKAHGLPVNPRNAYAAHVFGSGDAVKLLRADPTTPLASAIPDAKAVVAGNPQFRGKTVGQTLEWLQGAMDRAGLALSRQPRASGGKVDADIEPLVERLMRLAKHAKSATREATKPLLNVPDATIAKALDVAQRAI